MQHASCRQATTVLGTERELRAVRTERNLGPSRR
eukprot:COSAG02_NODE_45300_length_358_cov_0.996139_1_plen_33_part_10